MGSPHGNGQACYIAYMKATIEFDDALYRRLKIEAARRGRTVRELVAEGIRRVLDTPVAAPASRTGAAAVERTPAPWFGSLERYATVVDDHSMHAVRKSIAGARKRERGT